MTYVEHLLKYRASQIWPVSDQQQRLSAVEIEHAGATLRHWRICSSRDDAAIAASDTYLSELTSRAADAAAELLSQQPLSLVVVHDGECEIDQAGLGEEFADAFAAIGNRPAAVCLLDIWVVLVFHGQDERIKLGEDIWGGDDEKPSKSIVNTIEGGGVLMFYGWAKSSKQAAQLLADDGYFANDD